MDRTRIKFKAVNAEGKEYEQDAYFSVDFDHKSRWFVRKGDEMFADFRTGELHILDEAGTTLAILKP